MKPFFIILPAIVLLVYLFATYLGVFRKISFREETNGGFFVAYEFFQGDYKETGRIMDEIYYKLVANGIETQRGFGIYYDDPEKVATKDLRSESGCILEAQYMDQIDDLKEKFQVRQIPESLCLATDFPYKNKMSIFIGLLKVYPAFDKYLAENSGEAGSYIMEIYDIGNGKITYLMPLK